MPDNSTEAVVVTYGDRAELAIKTVRAARASGAERITVVINGGPEPNQRELEAGISEVPGTTILMAHNTGSAGGFHTGIADVLSRHECDLVWLLDDDNLAAPDTLAALIAALGDADAVMPLRHETAFLRALHGKSPPKPGSFMYFDLLERLRDRRPTESGPLNHLPYAPYGGLLVRLSAVERIGLPDAGLVLYEDDTEYTSRLTRHDAEAIRFEPSAEVVDIDSKWHQSERRSSLLFGRHPVRQYFAVRNRTRFDYARAMAANRRFRFAINVFTYVLGSVCRDLPQARLASGALFARAFAAGVRGDDGIPSWLAQGDNSLELKEAGPGSVRLRTPRAV